MSTAQIAIPPKLIPIFEGPADVRGAYGGRGSGKTRSFAKMAALWGYKHGITGTTGIILCARQFMNSLEDSSLEEVKRAIEDEPFLAAYYEIGDKYIKSKDGRISFSFAGLDRNIASIKSKGRLLLVWVDEAEPVTETAFTTLEPTLREEGSDWSAELWITWNPKRKAAAVETRFRNSKDPLVKIVELNWQDNPRFPAKLERQRLRDKAERPTQYAHVWDGAYEMVAEGAYFASDLVLAKEQGRIGVVPVDPLMTIRLFADLGGTGAKADNFVFWAAQFVGMQIRAIDHYEAQGQPGSAHVEWLTKKKYTPGKAQIWLPHDGDKQDSVYDASYAKHFEEAGYSVEVVPNQGKGAAKARIEAARRKFPSIWFNEQTTQPGIDALGWYHEKRDEIRGIGLGPEHDWASHSCFPAGTLVATRDGQMRIEQIEAGSQVLTPAGYARAINAGAVKVAKELVVLTLADGRVLRVTPDHGVFTTRGVVAADALRYSDAVFTEESAPCIQLESASKIGYRAAFIESFKATSFGFGRREASTFLKKAGDSECFTARLLGKARTRLFHLMWIGRTSIHPIGTSGQKARGGIFLQSTIGKSSMALGTTGSLRMATTHVDIRPLSTCIGLFGSAITGKFQQVLTFTMSMATRAITGLKTCSQYLPQTTQRCMPRKASGLAASPTSSSFGMLQRRLLSGIEARLERLGIESTGNRRGSTESGTKSGAKSAGGSISPHTNTSLATAVGIVDKRRVTAHEVVYDLTIEKHHCYFANGVLVSNCDAFGMMCLVHEIQGQPMKPIQYKKRMLT